MLQAMGSERDTTEGPNNDNSKTSVPKWGTVGLKRGMTLVIEATAPLSLPESSTEAEHHPASSPGPCQSHLLTSSVKLAQRPGVSHHTARGGYSSVHRL